MPHAYRIVKPKFASTAFDGEGAKLYGGRWNHKGTKIVYTSASPSLAAIESFIHMGVSSKFIQHIIIEIEIPNEIIEVYDISKLPKTWKINPTSAICQSIGTDWTAKQDSAVLALPSAVMDMEINYLINPLHPDFSRIKEIRRQDFTYDERMWK